MTGLPPPSARRLLPGLLLALVCGIGLAGGPAARGDGDDVPPWEDPPLETPDPATAVGPDADLFRKGLALQAEGRYRSARRAFWKLLDEHPESPFAAEAEDRSGENAFLGYTRMNEPRPSERRIDVALMGDGYLLDKQDRFDKDADGHLKVLLREPVFAEYEPYFNWWRFNLASKDTGVDEVERQPPDEEVEARRSRPRKRRPPREFETALDCKAAGPQGQVMADPERVLHYLRYLKVNDALAICFAQKGVLGMGGMGIATTGPKGVVVHEFGHAFVGLLDEYAVNPGEPFGAVEAANATTDRRNPPWRHFLDAKVPGVGVYEGGATFQRGVFRPAPSCAMNTGGSQYCPVCREAAVLMIYTYVRPVDTWRPREASVTLGSEGWPTFAVTPMEPATHDLDVMFFLGEAPVVTTPEREPEPEAWDPFLTEEERRMRAKARGEEPPPGEGTPPKPDRLRPLPARLPQPERLFRRLLGTANDAPPPGRRIPGKRRKTDDGGHEVVAEIPRDLASGHYLLTAVVRDDARPRGEKRSWVLKDERGLLEDRVAWLLEVPEPGR